MRQMIAMGMLCLVSTLGWADQDGAPSLLQVEGLETLAAPEPVPGAPTFEDLSRMYEAGLPLTEDNIALLPEHDYRVILGKASGQGRIGAIEMPYRPEGARNSDGSLNRILFEKKAVVDPLMEESEFLEVRFEGLGSGESNQGPFRVQKNSEGELEFAQFTYSNGYLNSNQWVEYHCKRHAEDARRTLICALTYDNTRNLTARDPGRSFEGYRVFRIFPVE